MPVFRDRPALLVAFRQGQSAALEAVYRAYVRSVDRYLRALARRSGDGELAQASAVADLLQEVFARAFSAGGRKSFDGVRDYGPYLTTIARNCFIDAIRVKGREVPTNPDDLSLAADDRAEVEPGWCDPKTATVVSAFIGALGPDLKGVYEQRFVGGQSQEAAAAALGLTRRAVRTAEKRLRVGLRKALFRAGISLREVEESRVDFSTRFVASPVKLERQP